MGKRRKKNGRSGNITNEPPYDPFPKLGLVKQFEQRIRNEVGKYCKLYPDLGRQELLFRAVEIAKAAEKAFKPKLGSFATYVTWRLKELHRLHDEDEKGNTSPVHYSKGELEQDRVEERGEDVELELSGGYNGARLTYDQQWWLAWLLSPVVNYISSLRPFAVDETEIKTYKTYESGKLVERTNYSRSYADNLIPTLESRHRVKAGVQLKGSDNAPAINQRISADLPEVVRQQPVGGILHGWIRAIFDHDIRRQREADDEAQKRLAGDHSPTFLEAEQHNVDVRFPGAKRPPKYLPARVPIASLDAPLRENEDGDAPGSLHEIVGGGGNPDPLVGEGLDKQADTMRRALEEIQPDLSKNERVIADEMLARLDGYKSRSLAGLGISKGYASKLWHGVVDKVAEKIRSRK
jgi:hypothetical protein